MSFGMDESAILLGCRRGDKTSWDLFVERYSKVVWWSIHETLKGSKFSSRPGVAEDIFQDFFSKLLSTREAFELRDAKSLPKFLTVAACHQALDKIKTLARIESRTESVDEAFAFSLSSEAEMSDIFSVRETPADEILQNERNQSVAEALGTLSTKERAIVEHYFYDELTAVEISKRFGISEDTVSSIVRRSKDKLREIFIKKELF